MMPGWLKRRPWPHALGWLALLAPLFYLSYGWANHLAGLADAQGRVPSVVFDWERHIPFWQDTIFPYWSINFFYGISLFLARTRHELRRHAFRLLTAQAVAVSCFILWPLRFSFGQPPADGAAGLLFAALRGFDQPFNQAPSLHIALAVILWDFYRRHIHAPAVRWFLHGWTLLICGAVLTTYQHHFIDIPTGALLGVVCVWLWPLERVLSMPYAWQTTCSGQRIKLALTYGVAAVLLAALALSSRLGRDMALWLLWPATSLCVVALCYGGLGARGFQMNSRGRMHWTSRWLLGPYRAGAWLNARLWTRRLPLASQVQPGLFLGRLPSQAEWLAADKPAIVSLCAELQNVDAIHGCCVPVLDLTEPDVAALQRTALMINARLQANQTVWVCCALGFSRSAHALAHSLMQSGAFASVEQARQAIAQARPQVVMVQAATCSHHG
jgi:protein-tyrosine phosphatase